MHVRVGIDISPIQYNRGVSRYTSNLTRALYKKKSDLVLRVFGTSFRQRETLQKFVQDELPNVHSKILPHPVKVMNVLWNNFHVLSPELFMGDMDVFHSWEMQPPLMKASLVTTIHDLAMLKFPKTADPYVLSMNQQSWKHIKREAKAVIAVSEATKKDIVELLQIDPKLVHVVHEALPEETRLTVTTVRKDELLKRFDITRPYLLFIGTMEPRKNLKRLIEAWKPLRGEVDLVLAGAAGWETIHKEQGMHMLGVVTNEELAALYKGSSALVYPSLYEGFGLPILDGFYHHTPVVTSNNSGMKEVAGSAAVLVEPENIESIREGIEKALQERSTFVEKGKKRLKNFSWEKVADETVEVYKRAVKK